MPQSSTSISNRRRKGNIIKMISAEQVSTKLSTSKSSRRKGKFVRKPKQVKQPIVNWLDLPSDVMADILSRIGVFDILKNAQKVCTTWHQICKEPATWRVVSMKYLYPCQQYVLRKIYKHAVDRSQGQMVDVSIHAFCDQDLLRYIANRSSQLRRLEITYSWDALNGAWGECLEKLSLLEELSVCETEFSQKDIEAVGLFCPLLKTLKVNNRPSMYNLDNHGRTTWAMAIGKNMPELRYLEFSGFIMTDVGLRAILDGCHHLESLNLSQFIYTVLKGDLRLRGVAPPYNAFHPLKICHVTSNH